MMMEDDDEEAGENMSDDEIQPLSLDVKSPDQIIEETDKKQLMEVEYSIEDRSTLPTQPRISALKHTNSSKLSK